MNTTTTPTSATVSADEWRFREEICEIGRRLYARNLVAATDGNVSVRLGDGRFLCTPSGVSKGFMAPETLPVCDASGAKLSGEGAITSEIFTHLAAYEERPDMAACVHAHPPNAIALMLAGLSMEALVIPEVVYAMGAIPTAPYATPGTPEGADAIRVIIRGCDAILMERHGALTLGPSLMEAYFRMEKLEHAAGCLVTAHLLGDVRPLSSDELRRLQDLRVANKAAGRAFYPG